MSVLSKTILGCLLALTLTPSLSQAQDQGLATELEETPTEEGSEATPDALPSLWGRNAALVAGTLTPGEVLIQGNINIGLPFTVGGDYPPLDVGQILSPIDALSPTFEMRFDAGTPGPIAVVGTVTSAGDLPVAGGMLGLRFSAEPKENEGLPPTFTLLLGVAPRLPWNVDWTLNAFPPPSTFREVLSPRVMAISVRGNVPLKTGRRSILYAHGRLEGNADIQELTIHNIDGTEFNATTPRLVALSAKIGPGIAFAVRDHSAMKVQLAYRYDSGKVGFLGVYDAHTLSFDIGIGGEASP